VLGEVAQIVGPEIVLGRFKDQQPTIKIDDALTNRRWFG